MGIDRDVLFSLWGGYWMGLSVQYWVVVPSLSSFSIALLNFNVPYNTKTVIMYNSVILLFLRLVGRDTFIYLPVVTKHRAPQIFCLCVVSFSLSMLNLLWKMWHVSMSTTAFCLVFHLEGNELGTGLSEVVNACDKTEDWGLLHHFWYSYVSYPF